MFIVYLMFAPPALNSWGIPCILTIKSLLTHLKINLTEVISFYFLLLTLLLLKQYISLLPILEIWFGGSFWVEDFFPSFLFFHAYNPKIFVIAFLCHPHIPGKKQVLQRFAAACSWHCGKLWHSQSVWVLVSSVCHTAFHYHLGSGSTIEPGSSFCLKWRTFLLNCSTGTIRSTWPVYRLTAHHTNGLHTLSCITISSLFHRDAYHFSAMFFNLLLSICYLSFRSGTMTVYCTMVVVRVWGERRTGSYCLMDMWFQGKWNKFWRWMLVCDTQQCECIECHRTVCLRMVKMTNYIMYIYYNKKTQKKPQIESWHDH